MSALPPSSKSAATSRSAVSALPSSSNALKERLYSEDELTLEFVPEDDAADCAAQNAATVETDSAQEALPAAEAAAGFDAKAFLQTVPNRPGCYRMYSAV